MELIRFQVYIVITNTIKNYEFQKMSFCLLNPKYKLKMQLNANYSLPMNSCQSVGLFSKISTNEFPILWINKICIINHGSTFEHDKNSVE